MHYQNRSQQYTEEKKTVLRREDLGFSESLTGVTSVTSVEGKEPTKVSSQFVNIVVPNYQYVSMKTGTVLNYVTKEETVLKKMILRYY